MNDVSQVHEKRKRKFLNKMYIVHPRMVKKGRENKQHQNENEAEQVQLALYSKEEITSFKI